MKNRTLAILAAVAIVAGAAGTAPAAAPSADDASEPTLGRPVHAQALYYTEMFAEKPYPEALLIYADNGSYKILSPGEDHYGSYVADVEAGAAPTLARFISWPSPDWGSNVAHHELLFNQSSGAFSQQLTLPGAPLPLLQYGYFATIPSPEGIDLQGTWDELRETYAEIFDALAASAER
ncbi:hypothetical protein [Microbacterium sp. NPDC089695]|uniref:hypothetical protein n=1 Tax=Microbacterium sp. NPDC089695 TaxID=3364198 RepID=UPI0038215300